MARLDTIDLRLLRVFVTVVEARGFTAAQTVLNVSASTISNQIAALETRLGVRLCQRGRAGFKLTEDGETIFTETQTLFAAIDGFDMRASALRARVRGTLAIGLLDNTITDPGAALPALFHQFIAARGDVQLSVEIKPPNELLRDLIEGKLHVAIGSFPKVLLGLTYLPLYEEPHLFYCGRLHPFFALAAEQVTTETLGRQRIVSRGYWGARDTKHIRSQRPAAVMNNMEVAAQLILSGDYLGYLPQHYAKRWVDAGEMKPLLTDELAFNAPFELAYDAAKLALPPVRLFVDLATRVLTRVA
ncbi:LysR family transcriptional regulator [Acidocella sp.]|uniref:LysR family transcriptional regulator n=1 Tax=Acidocella sp. TaxID=50710 RepID=UPI0026338F58|nr:LysR family transcriptional regulator [Acidocella sp.]